MNSYLRVSAVGCAAGILALLTWVLVIYLALAIFALAFTLIDELARARAAGMALEGRIGLLLGQSLMASGRNALHGLWNLWGAFLVFGALGILAAWSVQLGRLVDPVHAWWISFLGVAALVVIAALTWVFVQREQIILWMAESPETYRWRDILLDSQVAALTVGPIFALAIAYPAWVAWRWWFTKLGGVRVFGDSAGTTPTDLTRTSADDHRTYANRLAALKRGASADASQLGPRARDTSARDTKEWRRIVHSNRLLVLLILLVAVCLGSYIVANHYHAQLALRLQHGAAFTDATTQPHMEFPLRIASDVQRLRIVNINGLGAVSITLGPAGAPQTVVGEASDWTFEWRADEYLYRDIPVEMLTPGDYTLTFEQSAGWGYFEYMLSQGGGRTSQILAVATGLLLATSIVLGSVLAAIAIARVSMGNVP
jgi:hypothetical protein